MMGYDLKTSKCPKCGGIGMKHPPHAHAFGHYDYEIVQCRKRKKCGARYKTNAYEAWVRKTAEKKP